MHAARLIKIKLDMCVRIEGVRVNRGNVKIVRQLGINPANSRDCLHIAVRIEGVEIFRLAGLRIIAGKVNSAVGADGWGRLNAETGVKVPLLAAIGIDSIQIMAIGRHRNGGVRGKGE